MSSNRLMRWGFLLVALGLVGQIAAGLFWTPGTFILSAALGVPLVVAGAVGLWWGSRRLP